MIPKLVSSLRHAAQKHDVIVIHLEDPAERGRKWKQVSFGDLKQKRVACSLEGVRDVLEREPPIVQELIGAGISYLHLRSDQPFIPDGHFLLET